MEEHALQLRVGVLRPDERLSAVAYPKGQQSAWLSDSRIAEYIR